MVLDKQFLFIIGAPRSGTTWLQVMLGDHPAICTTVELTLFNRYLHPWLKAWELETANISQGQWHQGLPVLWSEDEFFAFLEQFLEQSYQKLLATRPEATHILDKHPGYTPFVAEINRFIPQARFIHIIRDGRDVAASMVAAKRSMGFGAGTVAAAAFDWKRHVLQARQAAAYQGRFLEVRYEELLCNEFAVLQRIFDFCNLPISSREIDCILQANRFDVMKVARKSGNKNLSMPEGHYRKGTSGTWKADFTPVERFEFQRCAGDLLQELGYADETWWMDSTLQRLSLPILFAAQEVQTGVCTLSKRARARLASVFA